MTPAHYTIAAYVVGLGLMWGYVAAVYVARRRGR